ncbi:MAG TPA: hypothetical protein VJN18_12200 [Polyangiaceae bacterium]|nr:hypothetical protein [Polyangiaceae bacterium]
MKYLNVLLTIGFAAWGLGCAADPGTQPHDASTAQHESMAAHEESAAAGHADQHDPSAAVTKENCQGKGGCWTSVTNPTAQHADDAKRHQELAQKHRAAAAALTDAEARACAGISNEDRDISPFYHREDIQSVSPLTETVKSGKATTQKEVGATIVFRATPGMTAEWLQRVADCHLARASSVGHEMPEMSYCPLVLKGAKAKVTSAGNGFAINVSADDPATVAEIKKRAQAFVGSSATP